MSSHQQILASDWVKSIKQKMLILEKEKVKEDRIRKFWLEIMQYVGPCAPSVIRFARKHFMTCNILSENTMDESQWELW